MRILVTGTAGFIGFHLAKKLLSQGHEVLGIDNFSDYYDVGLKEARNSILERLDGYSIARIGIEDQQALETVWREFNPKAVVHLAAQAGVRYSIDQPESYITANIVGTAHILELARRSDLVHLLAASTSSVYGGNVDMPFAETQKTSSPMSLYAATKGANELMGHSYSHLFKIPTTFFRFFTVYGPWGRPDMALFKFADAILNNQPFDVYDNGLMIRDFTYVDDLVEAISRLIAVPPTTALQGAEQTAHDSLSPIAPFRIVNIGGGKPIQLLAYIDALEEALGQKGIRNLLPIQDGDLPSTQASVELLHELIGYVPTTDLRVGIKAFVDWFRAYRANGLPA